MKLGTKSLLFGAHQFILHPIFVAIAYTRLYGFTFDPRIWIAFIVHDWGYWGKSDIDGKEGKTHPILGAKIMHELFDDSTLSSYTTELGAFSIRSRMWYEFTLYHSRFYAKNDGVQFSKLCYADKLAFSVPPMWLYLLLVNLTGEIHEYLNDELKPSLTNQIMWYKSLKIHFHNWILDHKNKTN